MLVQEAYKPKTPGDNPSENAFEEEEDSPVLPLKNGCVNVEDSVADKSRDDLCEDVRRPEQGKSIGEFLPLEKVAQVQDVVGDEAAFKDTEERTGGEKGCPSGDSGLGSRDDTPKHHLNRDPIRRQNTQPGLGAGSGGVLPVIWANFL